MLLKSNSSILAIGNKNSNYEFLNYIQSIQIKSSIERRNLKSLGYSLYDKILYTDPELTLDISFYQRTDFFNEKLFGFFITDGLIKNKSFLSEVNENDKLLDAYILFSNKENSDMLLDVYYNGFNEDMISIYLDKVSLNSYSISYSIGNIPLTTVSFSLSDSKISKIKKISDSYYLNTTNENDLLLNKKSVDRLFYQTNFNQGKNLINLKSIAMHNNIAETQAPISDVDNFLNGQVENLSLSIDLGKNKFYFFEKGNKVNSKEFLFPCVGSLEFSGKSSNFTEKGLQDFIKNDKKFTINFSLGVNDENSDYSEILVSNVSLEDFSYSININGFILYNIKCSFEIDESQGFAMNAINVKENLYIDSNIFSSDHHLLKVLETSNDIAFYS